MTQEIDFEQIRPFHDDEVPGVIKQLCVQPYFLRVLSFVYPGVPQDKIIEKLSHISTVDEFQGQFVLPFLDNLINTTTHGVTASGLDGLDPQQSYLFISNHRDIILDSALINVKLHERGIETTEIAIGDNLLIYDWITDLVKLNKSFVVRRNLPVRQQMEASETLSAFIRDSIGQRHQNIWIAQREGRSKDGDDQTQGSVLKMLNLSGEGSLVDNFKKLHIVPVSLSYEYDPCDYLKAFQFQMKRDDPQYKKSQNDDLTHMATGLRGRKGRIHISFGKPLAAELEQYAELNKNAQIQAIAELIDSQVYAGYHLWPANYAAYDMLHGTTTYADRYTADEKTEFEEYVDEHIARLDDCDEDFVRNSILQMYATPVQNQEKTL